jgi:hypothetical protein
VSKARYQLSQTIDNADSIELLQASIPMTYYQVNSSNDQVYVEWSDAVTATFTLTDGSYTPTSFANMFDLVAAAGSPAGKNVWTTAYNDDVNGFEFDNAIFIGGFKFMFATNTANSARRLMGLSASDSAAYLTAQLSNITVVMASVRNIIIDVTEAGNRSIDINRYPSYDQSAFIIPAASRYDLAQYVTTESHPQKSKLSIKNLRYLTVSIYDDEGNELDLNGGDYSLLLEITYLSGSRTTK